MMNDGFMSCLQEDVQLMVDIGLDAYRFSISWSRLIPNGRGPVNMKGLQYYNNLIDELIRNGIQPHVTLHHADLPLALEDEYGGWINQKIVRDFTSYADVCFREFGDRVLHWTTLNEANVFVLGGYDLGFQPPRRCSATFPLNCSKGNSSTEPYMAAHNILLAHAAVAKLYKKKYQDKQHGLIGLNLFNYWFVPLTNTTEDIIAAQRANDFYVGWFMHPLVYGDYPSLMKKTAGSRMPAFTNIESNQVKGSFDFIGLNYYLTMYVKDQPSSLEMEQRDVVADMAIELMRKSSCLLKPRPCLTQFPIIPWGLKRLLEYFKEAYGNPPIYIHENGGSDSRLEDVQLMVDIGLEAYRFSILWRDFTAYADVCFREFGDRVLHWTTLNEANVFVLGSYDLGVLPPRRCSLPFNCSKGNSSTEPYMAVHNILLAHAAVARLYKKKYQDKQQGFIGINLLNNWFLPLTNTTEDKIAVQRANDMYLGWFMDPLVYGDYPSSIKKNAGSRLPAFTNRQSKRVKAFEFNASTFEFPITPWGLKGLLQYLKETYGSPPIYIHENGQRMRRNSLLEDWRTVKSLNAYIGSVLEAIRSGSDTRGYFTWSILDVFELQDGYESSFGLYYVDLDGPDLTRYPKLSAKWYAQFLKGKGRVMIHPKGLSSLNNAPFTL
ncbi:hypothetical protein QUC31_019155 [Theobroma cacao]